MINMTNTIGKFMVAVGAIIENTSTGKILMLKRSDDLDFSRGIWESVTGRMDQFEEPEQALRREIKEEAGIEVEIIKPISIFHIFRGERDAENELIGIMYWCKTESEQIIISKEHTDYKWVEPQKAINMVPKPGMKVDIEAFIKEKLKER